MALPCAVTSCPPHPHPFPSKGLFACPGHRQFFLCSHPSSLASRPRRAQSSWPAPSLLPASHTFCSMPCSVPLCLSLPTISTSLDIWVFKLN